MKLLWICSALDMRYRFGCTPNWWQFLKGLYEIGHDVIAIPYMGNAFETPWWRSYPNPCYKESVLAYKLKPLMSKGATSTRGGVSGYVASIGLAKWIRPKWRRYLVSLFNKEKHIDAVIIATVPMNHLTGIPSFLQKQFSVPVIYWDGDVPASLPRFGGFASGFKIYEDADLSEYNAIFCNSEGGAEELLTMGARAVYTIHWGFDPTLYEPLQIEEDQDVYFYGVGKEYREEWIEMMLVRPSLQLPQHKFVVGGKGFPQDMGKVIQEGDVPFNVFRHACCRSKINLSITRSPHATVYASSTGRIFELAFMGRCIVSNPHLGMERWFEPGKDLIIVNSEKEVNEAYRSLLTDSSLRKVLGDAARRTALERHTHIARAHEIVNYIKKL